MFNVVFASQDWDRLTPKELILIGMLIAGWLLTLLIGAWGRK